jgi:hypothetical protein
MMLCAFFGLLNLGEGSMERASDVAPESRNAQQMLEFLNTLAFAAAHKVGVLIDG